MITATVGNPTTGHSKCWPPTIIAQGVPTVLVTGIPCATMSSMCIPHNCGPSVHPVIIAQGSTTVLAQGLPVSRMGDMAACTDVIAMGSPTVLTGG